MNREQESLFEELDLVDTDLGFLFLIVMAVLLSFCATVRQRDALWLTIQGNPEEAACVGEVSSMRLATGALVAGSLGFFFMQALNTCRTADPHDPVACRSARFNVVASFLVLLAALIRLLDLNFVRRAQPSLAQDLPPD